jgi:hypothetical protein
VQHSTQADGFGGQILRADLAGYTDDSTTRPGDAVTLQRKPLPIGIQTFRKIREGNDYYMDKSGFALRMTQQGTHDFLSRPRRLGKSLFIDILVELFTGNEALFRGIRTLNLH